MTKEAELQEIADGAWGDNPMVRGLARDKLAKAQQPKPEKPAKHPVKHPEREHKPRPLDDDAMPPIITPDLPER